MLDNASCSDTCFLARNGMAGWMKIAATSGHLIRFKKKQLLFKAGDRPEGIYVVGTGVLKIHQPWGNGRELIVRFAAPGDVVGHRGIGVTNQLPASATALESGDACCIPMTVLEMTASTDSGFPYAMMQLYARQLQLSEERIRDMAYMTVKGRLAGFLLSMRDRFNENAGGYIQLPVTRHDIAAFAGTTYETVFRLLSGWEDKGLIHCSGKYIRILDPDALSLLCRPE